MNGRGSDDSQEWLLKNDESNHDSHQSPRQGGSSRSSDTFEVIDAHRITRVTLSIRISLWTSTVGFLIDLAGYLLYYRIFEHENPTRESLTRFALIPEIGALIFGIFAWVTLFYSGLFGESMLTDRVLPKIAVSFALATNFLFNTSLGFVFDHFVMSHHQVNWQSECVLSKLMSVGCILGFLVLTAGYSFCCYGRFGKLLDVVEENILSAYQATYTVLDRRLGLASPYYAAETSAEARWILAKTVPRVVAECFIPVSLLFKPESPTYWQANAADAEFTA